MLIIEGSDLVGKTTLIKRVSKELDALGYPVIYQHFGLLPKDWNYYSDYIKFMNRRVIMDRFIMSEVVYGTVVRNKSKISPAAYRLLDAHLRLYAATTVVITTSKAWLEKQIKEKYGDRYEAFSKETILKVNTGFNDLFRGGLLDGNDMFICDYDIRYDMDVDDTMPAENNKLVATILNTYICKIQILKQLTDIKEI